MEETEECQDDYGDDEGEEADDDDPSVSQIE
jgi:hypothetical protein